MAQKYLQRKKKEKRNEEAIFQIVQELLRQDRDVNWLSKKTKINYHALYAVFKLGTNGLSDKNKIKINKALNTNF